MPEQIPNKPGQTQPICDVVTVNFNAGAFLHRCVKSVYRSDVPVSLSIIDNASVDDSIEQIKRLNPAQHQLNILNNSENVGFSKAVNQGARSGKAPFILLLNPDCEIHPHTIRNLLAEVKNCADMGVLGALVFNEDGTEQRGCRRLEPTFTRSMVTALRLGKYFQSVNLQYDELPESPISIDAVSGSAMLIARDTFEAINGMDEGYFLHVEDLDFCRRVREFGKKVYFTPNVSLFHHHGASSHGMPVSTEWHKHQGMLRYQSKFQKPNQSAVRSHLTRAVVYLNFALSVVRKRLSRSTLQMSVIQSLTNFNQDTLLVTGASSDLGQAVLREFKNHPALIAVSRQEKYPQPMGQEHWLNWAFFEKVPKADFTGVDNWLALSPVWAASSMAKTLHRFGRIRRVLALSSTSIEGKADSVNPKEQAVVDKLIRGEQDLLDWAGEYKADLTICRASMIYGGAHNQNIAFIKRVIKWLRFFPMLSQGAGLRQPVHIDDIASTLRGMNRLTNLPQKTYVLAGGERLSYHSMVEKIFKSMEYKVKLKIIPEEIFMRLADVLAYIPGLRFINREMIGRIERDLVYDIKPAKQDFAYSPGKFRP